MDSISFEVSAKTARLIGRENISDVDGAILELIKNSYDADADCVYVKYVNPYNKVPDELGLSEIEQFFDKKEISNFYEIKDGRYVLKTDLSVPEKHELKNMILSLSRILVLDNGCGMTQEILKTTWMNIGTDDKEINILSESKKRIKTGAKGIGRFALDKLSLKSQVITKNKNDEAVSWELDWTQFDNAKLLNQVKANINIVNDSFVYIIKGLVGSDYEKLSSYDWSTGTAIILTPIRDFWNKKLYEKVNSNLQNINPLGNVDKFDIIVKNATYPALNYESYSEGISRECYDYMIEAEYDGKDNIKITFDRNEIDINVKGIIVDYSDTDKETYDLGEFWNREIFQREKYKRETFNGRVEFEYTLKEILTKQKDEPFDEYSRIGPFIVKIFYLKNQKSTVEIIRDFKSQIRKKLLNSFSGIKIYRDKFKVRPYGDEGVFYDWLNLSERVQKSPAAASHESGNWRVSPNQVIGSISISRITNPNLEDTANREGMNLNQEYYAFVKLLQGIFEKFEYDRQFPLREYALWFNAKKNAHQVKLQTIYEQVMKEKENAEKEKTEQKNKFDDKKDAQEPTNEESNDEYSKEDLKDVIYSIGKKNENEMTTNQLLTVLSSAGVMAQTFSHEISRVATNLGSRGQHLKESINRLLNYQPYSGDEDFDPFDMIDELNSTDALLSEWVNLIMESVNKENFYTKVVELKEFLEHIRCKWLPLLNRKYIKISNIKCSEEIELSLPAVDLHLLLNNFILNSAYFLEECDGERVIEFKVYKQDAYILLDMKNNGPELDERYKQNPDEILNARESSKRDGTGLGLWVAREAVNRNQGSLHVIPIKEGFMLQASWRL
ncbi:ATP-binding protein [Clostridium sp. BNL1100]|uniref:sensor histidine kinase n=1 Tax=Clostridium sp. BNL1100 TaxID=755731 RepID=UPI00024A76C7|nr:ATP-binding protein [Clostridium sp. BNL1100]AEY65602.1 histidine kinase [Clostridium sp. BNL1100]